MVAMTMSMKMVINIGGNINDCQDEFQYSRNHRDNTWVQDGVLHVT